MEAKYHIITDIECRVLHYGTEICIVTPGKDSCIFLKKGRHLLSFVSVENSNDSRTMTFEVPQNDIEDFINVELSPRREQRLAEEAIAKRELEEIEAQRKAEEEEKKRRELDQKEQEQNRRRQEEVKARELYNRCQQLAKIFQEAKAYDDNYRTLFQSDRHMIPFKDETSGLFGYKKQSQNGLCDAIPAKYERSCRKGLSDNYIYSHAKFIVSPMRFFEGKCGLQDPRKRMFFIPDEQPYYSKVKSIPLSGFIDEFGNVSIDFKYLWVQPFSYDRAFVGKPVIKEYRIWKHSIDDSIKDILDNNEIVERHENSVSIKLPVVLKEEIVCIDKKGNELFCIEPSYKGSFFLFPFSQGLSICLVLYLHDNNEWGVIRIYDRDGNIVKYININDGHGLKWARCFSCGYGAFNNGVAQLYDSYLGWFDGGLSIKKVQDWHNEKLEGISKMRSYFQGVERLSMDEIINKLNTLRRPQYPNWMLSANVLYSNSNQDFAQLIKQAK